MLSEPFRVAQERRSVPKRQEPVISVPPYDLLLCDAWLPDGGGLDLLAYVRQRGLPLAVVLMATSGDEESVVTALKAGAEDYLIKGPGLLERLPQSLEAALARFRAGEALRQQPLRVLYAERSLADIELTRFHLERHAPYIHLEAVGSGPEVLDILPENGPACVYDLLLLDYRLPGMNAIEVLREVRARGLDLPVVIVTGHGGQEIALQTLKMGATDYVVKTPGYLDRLPWVIETAVHRARLLREQAALRESESRYRALLMAAPDALITTDADGQIILWNAAAEALLGWSAQEIVGQGVE
ncbi:MAG: response regulator [Chloroflexia bacterium]